MPFKAGLELTELQNMTVPEDDNISNDSNDFTEVENGQINSKFISDRESRRSLTNSHLEKKKCDEYQELLHWECLSSTLAMQLWAVGFWVLLLPWPTYEKLGEQIFGTPGRMIVFGSTSLQNVGAMLSYLFIVKNELPSAIKFLMGEEETFSEWYVDGRILVVTVTFCIILPLCLLKNLGYLGYTSGFSLSCMVFFLVVVIYKKFQIPCDGQGLNATSSILSNSSEHTCKPKYVIFNSKTVYALPTIAFAFVCHPSVLPIYSELKDRSQKKMQLVSNISFFAMFLMYFMTAIFGYLTFYENVQSDLLHKYQSKDDILILTVRLAVIVAVILTVPVLFFTVRSSLFEMARKTKFDLCRHVLVTFVLLVIINLLVIFIPSMKDIFGVVGVTSANMLIFILPSSLYLKITQQDGSKLTQRIWASLFLALGVLFSLVSIPLVIYDWVQSGGSAEGH
uniref:Solute carrier family 38 member 1 n=1 Tax=Taeniopygia guttata TaxID=59729 RepID=A0A674HTE2_TAEGU